MVIDKVLRGMASKMVKEIKNSKPFDYSKLSKRDIEGLAKIMAKSQK